LIAAMKAAFLSLAPLLLLGTLACAADIPLAERRSGYEQMGASTRAMQDDDSANPGMLWVLDGAALWARRDGAAAQSCADCHGDAALSMRGVAARYPMVDAATGKALDLEARINEERRMRQQAPVFAYESKELLALTSYVANQSRGLPIALSDDEATRRVIAAGRALFERRQGQINLSCAECHDENWGKSLAGAPIPQAHPTGYPLYRLEWQTLGSLQRRLRNCIAGLRAEPYAFGAEEYVALEMYLMWRARGLAMESPAVRP
jgi:sulfur-oxidizing protein SoxA